MNLSEISLLRLQNLQISNPEFSDARRLLNQLGAVQAQDYGMAKWAIGLRLPGSTDASVEAALDSGEIFRTHVMRPTWHLVAPEDICGMIQLTAARIRSSFTARHRDLGIDATVLKKSNSILKKALAGNNHLSREELIPLYEKAKIPVNENRLSHLLMSAEIDLLICSGKSKGKQRTYALLEDRVQIPQQYAADAVLEKLARTYFSSHGPATLADFTWWSGLSPADARKGLAMIQSDFSSVQLDGETYWYDAKKSVLKKNSSSLFLLPAFDEFIVSYKDRAASLSLVHNKKVISENGLFRPTIVYEGQVIGLWKRTIGKNKLLVEAAYFHSVKKEIREMTAAQAEWLGRFYQLKTEVKHGRHE